MSLRLVDMRSESSFRAGIAPAGDDKVKISILIVKNQLIYPFVQGFLWAVFKDWLVVAKLFASTSGSQVGLQLRHKIASWFGGWMSPASKDVAPAATI